TIGMAVVFAILLVTANAMMMSARERTGEVAVLKTIGFSDWRLFGLVMLEAGLITLTGAVLGLGGAKLLYRATNFNAAGFLPCFAAAPTPSCRADCRARRRVSSLLRPTSRPARTGTRW